MNIGEVIVNLRKQKGIKQKEIAEGLGISVPYLSRIENNEQKPSVDLIVKIANFLDVPVSAIVFMGLDLDAIENKEQKKYFKTAQPIIDRLMEYLLSGDSTTKGQDPLAKIKHKIPVRKKA